MLYTELPVAFPWYDKVEKQNRYNEHTGGVCDYKLITPKNALLPFQFYRQSVATATRWEIFEANSQVLVANITGNLGYIRLATREGRVYHTYTGGILGLPGGGGDLNLTPGFYYSKILFADNTAQFSEMFFVPENAFNIQDDNDADYLKLQWYNSSDIRPVFYNDIDPNGNPYFKNIIYLDTFVHASEPEITEDGTRDGDDELITTFQKVVIPYRITVVVPDFLKKALCVMALHSTVTLRTKHGVREGTLESVKINSALEASGALSVVDILFRSDVAIVAKGCADNMS